MVDYLIALSTVALAWWLSTGIVLLLNRQQPLVRNLSLLAVTLGTFAGLTFVPTVGEIRTATGALLGFAQGLLFWAWLEATYLMGLITGPRKTACPTDASSGRRFLLGIATSLYHEISVVLMFLMLWILSADSPNRVALITYTALWLMRWSAKLNLFLGVRNYNSHWFPEHLQHLDTYTRRSTLNPLFPLSVTLGTAAAVAPLAIALISVDPYVRSANLLVSALLMFAVLEHWFLMFPFGESALWSWALQNDEGKERKEGISKTLLNDDVPPRKATVHRLRTGQVVTKT
ncbi:MAG: putative photosynthetic complex assembly protein PuhE [Pseudomonadota bacterium]